MSFGEKIRALRIKRELSQQDLADSINRICQTHLKRNTISNYERNKSFPDYNKLIAIVNILDTSSDTLLGLNSKGHINGRLSSNSDGITYSGYVEESIEKEHKNFLPIDDGSSPDRCEIKYILTKEHNSYSKNCNIYSYIETLPSLRVPYLKHTDLRAFELPQSFESSKHSRPIKSGDIVICRQIETPEPHSYMSFYIIVWENCGLKILRYNELLQLMELPHIIEMWKPITIIHYGVDTV